MLAGVTCLGLVAAGVVATRDDTTTVTSANTPDVESPAVETPAVDAEGPAPSEGFPKVSIDLAGLDLTQASARTEASAPGTVEPAHVQVFRPAGTVWALPFVEVLTGTEANMGIGRGNPAATIVDVNGADGHLASEQDTTMLGWDLPDGTQTLVIARGIEPDAVIDLARSMEKRSDAPGWDVTQIETLGLAPSVDGSPRFPEGQLAFHNLQFEGSGGEVELNASTASAASHESRVVDYLTAGDIEVDNTTVLGHPAVVARGIYDARILWYDAGREASTYLIVTGELQTRIDDIVDSIVELDDSRWADLLERANGSNTDDATTGPSTTIAPPSKEATDAVEAAIIELLPAYTNATELTRSPGVFRIRVTDLDDSSFTLDVYAPDRFDASEMEQLDPLPDTTSGRAWLGADDSDLRSVYLLGDAGLAIRVESSGRDGAALRSIEELTDLADKLASSSAVSDLRSEIGE